MSTRLTLLVLPGSAQARAVTEESFAAQGEGPWELCHVDGVVTAKGGSTDEGTAGEPTTGGDAHGELAAQLNAAAARARGRYTALLAAGDRFEPGALPAVVEMLDHLDGGAEEPAVLYTDESGPGGPFHKPRWVPAYLEAWNYLGRLTFVRADLLAEAGGWRPGAAMEWDLAVRVTEQTSAVVHVPVTGLVRGSQPPSGTGTWEAGRRAVAERYARLGVPARVELTGADDGEAPGFVRVWREVPDPPFVSIVIPTVGARRNVRGTDTLLVAQALRSLVERTTYTRWEAVLVTSEGTPAGAVGECRGIVGDRLTVVPVEGAFNFSRSVNAGAAAARGEQLLLLNDDVEPLQPRWLERMVAVAADPEVGVVGAKLLFEDGRVQHVGVSFQLDGEPMHPHIFEADDAGYFGSKVVDMDHTAVTGACLLTPRVLFAEVGGFSEDLPLNYNDVDYCLKVRAAGRRVLCTPFARLYHYESSSREAQIDREESAAMAWWRHRTLADPYTNIRGLA